MWYPEVQLREEQTWLRKEGAARVVGCGLGSPEGSELQLCGCSLGPAPSLGRAGDSGNNNNNAVICLVDLRCAIITA